MRKLKYIAAAAALLMAASAWAGQPGNNGNGNGGCGQGQQTNGCGTTTPPASSNAANGIGVGVGIAHGGNATGGNATANGGAGGQGGAGGMGGVGIGGSVAGSGNSHNTNINANSASNRNDIRNTAQQHQGQSQRQGQDQTAVGIGGNQRQSASASNGGNTLQGTQANGQSVSVTGDTVNYAAQARQPVATAYAPNIMPTAVCMGSTSVGGQGITFGISVGTSWTDGNCQLLEQVRTTASVLGDTTTAAQMMCAVPAYAKAREATGHPCGGTAAPAKVSVAPAAAESQKLAAVTAANYTGSDPFIRSRLGLPPLKN